MSVRALYMKATSASMLAKLFTSFGAVIVIWQLNQIAGKDGFGLIMLAYSLNYILAASLAALFQSILTYHVSRSPDEHTNLVGACLFYAVTIGIAMALAESAFAQTLAQAMSKPDVAQWFSIMAWMLPAFAANSILTSWYRAKQDVPTMVKFFEVGPMLTRIVLFAIIQALALQQELSGYAYALSYALPFCILFLKSPVKPSFSRKNFTLWDISYGFQSLLSQMVNKSIRNLTIFILGFFVSAGAIADLTLAMRFGQFLQMPKLAIGQLQIPRIGKLLKEQNTKAIQREFDTTRNISLMATILGCLAFIVMAPYIFQWFGDYQSAYKLLLLLAVASIIRAGFGTVGGYLNIAGYAGIALAINCLTLALLFIALLLLVPSHGTIGASIALIIGAAFSMLTMAILIFKQDKMQTQTGASVISLLLSSSALTLYCYDIINLPLAACLLIGSIIPLLKSLIKLIKQKQ